MEGKSYFSDGRRQLNGWDWFFSILLFATVVYVLWYYVWRWMFISVDIQKQQVIVYQPFQLRKHSYEFTAVKGFYFTEKWSKWCEIKELTFVMSADVQIKISDLETGNLRKVEVTCWELFPLLDQKTKAPLSGEEQQIYRTTVNKEFDYRQAKSIRTSLIISLVTLVLIALMDYFMSSDWHLPVIMRAGMLLMIAYIIYETGIIGRRIRQLQQ